MTAIPKCSDGFDIYSEMDSLSDRDKCRLENNYITAYGSTAHATLIMNNKILTISIGDGGIFFLQ